MGSSQNYNEQRVKKTTFLAICIAEVAVFMFTENLIHLIKKIPGATSSADSIITFVQLLGAALIINMIYELNAAASEPISSFLSDYNEFKKEIKTQMGNNSRNLGNVHDWVLRNTAETCHGQIKEIKNSKSWEFYGSVKGWNPHWNIENDGSDLGVNLRKVHYNRLIDDTVTDITYIFLENYEFEVNDNDNISGFGVRSFEMFINKLMKEHNDKEKIRIGLSKYRIWSIPKELWKQSNNLSTGNNNLSDWISKYKDVMFISGRRKAHQNLILFLNMDGFVVNKEHDYYLEVYDDNKIYTGLTRFFERTVKKLEDLDGVTLKRVVWHDNSDSIRVE